MAIHIEWGTKNQSLLIWRVTGEITLEEYIAASKQTGHLVQSALYPVTLLIDLRKCQYTTHNLIPTLREQIRKLQSFRGEIVVFTKTQFWPNLYHIAAQSSIGVRLPTIRFHITQDENGDILAALS